MSATELGKAYIQIMPSAQGLRGEITKELNEGSDDAGKSAGTSFASNLVSVAKGVITAAAIGKAISASITEGANLQQSIGGIETLFKDNAGMMVQYANEAYKTAGISANSYMEQVTSFSASLLQSLGGDTKAAGEAANQAIIDMADNSNKMGTSLESIQNAYQGFAKQNYTMLDNLKLGYGGTKSEMERLLSDAEKFSGVKYDINNLNDVYSAIHVVQNELGITGTTAKEAATTLSGSAASMKAAFSNVLGNLALGEDIRPALNALLESTSTFLFGNFLPMISNILAGLPDIFRGIVDYAPALIESVRGLIESAVSTVSEMDWLGTISEVLNGMLSAITENAPMMIEGGVQLVTNLMTGLMENLPMILDTIGQLMSNVLTTVMTMAPQLLAGGATLVMNLVSGLISNLPAILSAAGNLVLTLLNTVMSNAPQMITSGITLVTNLVTGLLNQLPRLVSAALTAVTRFASSIASNAPRLMTQGAQLIGQVASGILGALGNIVSAAMSAVSSAAGAFNGFSWSSVGSNIISGIVGGISGAAGALFSSLRNLASNALSAAKSALGIASPSKVFKREVGQWIPRGIAEGIDGENAPVLAINRQVTAMIGAGREARTADYGNTTNYGGFSINIYPSPSQSPSDIADEISRRINEATLRKAAAWA